MDSTAARKLFTPNIRPIISTAKHIKNFPHIRFSCDMWEVF
jgi:hypothetical protein